MRSIALLQYKMTITRTIKILSDGQNMRSRNTHVVGVEINITIMENGMEAPKSENTVHAAVNAAMHVDSKQRQPANERPACRPTLIETLFAIPRIWYIIWYLRCTSIEEWINQT